MRYISNVKFYVILMLLITSCSHKINILSKNNCRGHIIIQSINDDIKEDTLIFDEIPDRHHFMKVRANKNDDKLIFKTNVGDFELLLTDSTKAIYVSYNCDSTLYKAYYKLIPSREHKEVIIR